MINRLLDWFKTANDITDEPEASPHRAAAALLVEVAFADHEFTESEQAALPTLLRQYTGLDTEEAIQLIEIAHEAVDQAVDLREFTHYLNENFSIDEKLDLVTVLWRVAYADQDIDKYEEHLIRKIADLLHLRHSEYIQCKHRVLN